MLRESQPILQAASGEHSIEWKCQILTVRRASARNGTCQVQLEKIVCGRAENVDAAPLSFSPPAMNEIRPVAYSSGGCNPFQCRARGLDRRGQAGSLVQCRREPSLLRLSCATNRYNMCVKSPHGMCSHTSSAEVYQTCGGAFCTAQAAPKSKSESG